MSSGGTLTFNLAPNDPDADYDWAIFGPNVLCGNLGAPIRCNAATVLLVGAATGLNMTSNITNAPGGSFTPYCRYLDVMPGQTYYLFIDNWVDSTNTTIAPFSLTWGGTATLASPFTNPTTQPHPFNPPGLPAVNPTDPREVVICHNPSVFDFSTLSTGILNGNPNFSISYHTSQNDALTGNNQINIPLLVDISSIYYYSINYTDPSNSQNTLNKCKQIGKFKFKNGKITVQNSILTQCNNNNSGTAVYDLTTANVIADPTVTKKFYRSLFDLNSNSNEITNPSVFISSESTIYVRITSTTGCSAIAQIELKFYPVIVVSDVTLRSCYIENSQSMASFNLSEAQVTLQNGNKKYYPSLADAVNEVNEILIPSAYIAPDGVAYVRVSNTQGCYNIAKITLAVLPQLYSSDLKNKIICIADTTILDAGPGFDSYQWSTGKTTQVINNISVGAYWVKLKKGECTAIQHVQVYASEQPIISNVDISNNTIIIFAKGGKPPYKYSMDNVYWQESNIFTNVSRGDNKIFVKDSFDCDPTEISITFPNIVNVITPNGDGYNDDIDYSALSNKKNENYAKYHHQMHFSKRKNKLHFFFH